MAKLRYSAEDLLKGKLVEEVGWYPVRVSGIEEKEARDGSQNIIVTCVIEDGKYKGVPVLRYYNEKGAGFIKNIAEAAEIALEDNGGVFDFDLLLNKSLDAYIEQRKDDEGNMRNDIKRFRARPVEVG